MISSWQKYETYFTTRLGVKGGRRGSKTTTFYGGKFWKLSFHTLDFLKN